MQSGNKEWRLATYRCFRESARDNSGPSSLAADQSASATTTNGEPPDGIWLTRRDHSAAPLVLRLSNFAHFVVIQGSEVVESFFLILAKKWIKMVNIDDELMLYIRTHNRVRRLRLTFPSVDEARDCYGHLCPHVSVKTHAPPSANEASSTTASMDLEVQRWLDLMTGRGVLASGCTPGDVEKANAAWDTNWPTERLLDLVKLCLLDPNFPGFVGQVKQCLSLLAPAKDGELEEDVVCMRD